MKGGYIVVLIIYYVASVIIGDLADYLIGLIVEREFGGHASSSFSRSMPWCCGPLGPLQFG